MCLNGGHVGLLFGSFSQQCNIDVFQIWTMTVTEATFYKKLILASSGAAKQEAEVQRSKRPLFND